MACARTTGPITFRLPDHYTGVFVVYEDSTSGIELDPDNTIVIINDKGEARVKRITLFGRLHKEIATRADGTIIQSESAGNDEISIFPISSMVDNNQRAIYYYVGNLKGYEAASRVWASELIKSVGNQSDSASKPKP